jgi:hypothetical protein
MKNYIITFTIPFFVLFSVVVKDNYIKTEKPGRHPLTLAYRLFPPDSIQDFMRIYFQVRGYELNTFEENMNNLKAGMQNAIMDLKDNNSTDIEAAIKKYVPASTMLQLFIFNKPNQPVYHIDSIKFKILKMPTLDTFAIVQHYIPDSSLTGNCYSILKDFADKLISKKLLE